jgi:ABC-type multidrug transport system fused ATPase/permease subunit
MSIDDARTDNIARGGKSVVQGFGSLGMMLSISPHLTAVMVACVLPITVGAAFYGKRVSSLSRSIQDTGAVIFVFSFCFFRFVCLVC